MKKLNLIGNQYGKLTVIQEHSKSRSGKIKYLCQCECGGECSVFSTHLRQGNTKSCGCTMVSRGQDHKQWKGSGEISGNFWYNHVVRSATGSKGRRYSVELSISIEDGWKLFEKQERKCALTGIKLKFPSSGKDKDWNASLDRIDSSKGYIEGNVQWVHKDINIMKNKYEQKYFIEMCRLIAGGGCAI